MGRQIRCTIIMYHYVRNMYETEYPKIKGLLIKKFEDQLDYIQKKYKVISLEDYIEFLKDNKQIPNNSCILTFDDGFKDHYVNVFPILKKRKLSASFFPQTQPLVESVIPSVHKSHLLLAKVGTKGFADGFNGILKDRFPELVKEYFVDDKIKKEKEYRWDDNLTANLKWSIATMPIKSKVEIINQIFSKFFDNEKALCEELYMNWSEMGEMIGGGMSFGNHSHTHPILSCLTKREQTKEIEISMNILNKKLKIKNKLFSYPYGKFNKDTIKILKDNGYICGVTTNKGINEENRNSLMLKRVDTNDLPTK